MTPGRPFPNELLRAPPGPMGPDTALLLPNFAHSPGALTCPVTRGSVMILTPE